MKTKRAVILAVVLLLITAVVAIAAARVLTSSVSISIAAGADPPPPPPPTLVIEFDGPWGCLGDATITDCSENASGGVNANFTEVGDVAAANLRASRMVINPTTEKICITASGLSAGGVVGTLLYNTIQPGASSLTQMKWDVSALSPGDSVVIPSAALSYDFCP